MGGGGNSVPAVFTYESHSGVVEGRGWGENRLVSAKFTYGSHTAPHMASESLTLTWPPSAAQGRAGPPRASQGHIWLFSDETYGATQPWLPTARP